jgi:2-phospho-L-lactate guanylyltransferase
MRSGPDAVEWVVVVAAKRLDAAKSRLADATLDHRADLALGMLLDTVSAARSALSVRAVLVVTEDERIAGAVSSIGATAVTDQTGDGLNGAFQEGIAAALQRHPDAGVALLAGDLPAVRSAEIESVLRAAADAEVIVVADHLGTGTTTLASRTPTSLRPAFGAGSFARHLAAGAVSVTGALPGLRHDVDTAADLAQAVDLGLGPATATAYDSVVED